LRAAARIFAASVAAHSTPAGNLAAMTERQMIAAWYTARAQDCQSDTPPTPSLP